MYRARARAGCASSARGSVRARGCGKQAFHSRAKAVSPGPIFGGMQATEESFRAAVCEAAEEARLAWPAEPDRQRTRIHAIWDSVIDGPASGMYDKAWCGAFALSCLRDAQVTRAFWVPGIGFCERYCTHTNTPRPGDIAYFDQPYQHHAVVTYVDSDNFDTIDGNQPGIMRHKRRPMHSARFYSISPMIDRALEEMRK